MAALVWLTYINLFMFSVSGLLLYGAVVRYRDAGLKLEETRRVAMRVLLLRRKG